MRSARQLLPTSVLLASLSAVVAPALPSQSAAIRARAPSAADLAWLRAQPVPLATITDLTVNLNGVPTDVGDIDVTHAPNAANTHTIMSATFRPAPGLAGLHHWMTFHWVQVIVADACPALYAGAALPFAQVDPPRDGWDYMYDGPGLRVNPNWSIPNFGHFLDSQPWYWNSAGEAANSTPGVAWGINDMPIHCGPGGVTTFETWLVAEGPGRRFCLIRGFSWSISNIAARRAGPTDTGAPTLADAAQVSGALRNSAYPEWTCEAGCRIDWGHDVLVSVDDAARRVGMAFQLNGPPLGFGLFLLAGSVTPGVPTPFGNLYLDPATLMVFAPVPLNAAGFGELRLSLAATDVAGLQVASQGVVADATTARLTNYTLLGGHYLPGLLWELLAARYHGGTDRLYLAGRAVPGNRLDVAMQNPGGVRQALGPITVPPLGVFAAGYVFPGFAPGGSFEVTNGARRLMRLQ
jgi:hypothetical protein